MRISDAATDKIASLLKMQGVLSENRLMNSTICKK